MRWRGGPIREGRGGLVLGAGLEPARLTAKASKTFVSAISPPERRSSRELAPGASGEASGESGGAGARGAGGVRRGGRVEKERGSGRGLQLFAGWRCYRDNHSPRS